MKKIEAFIRHEAFDEIRDRLDAMGLPSMSVTEVKGSGRQKGFTESYRGAKTTIFLRPKLKLEIAVDDVDLERAIDTIMEYAHTGEPGDGKIFVYSIEDAIRVRTGEWTDRAGLPQRRAGTRLRNRVRVPWGAVAERRHRSLRRFNPSRARPQNTPRARTSKTTLDEHHPEAGRRAIPNRPVGVT